MKISQRVQNLKLSPIRKLTPYADAAKKAGVPLYCGEFGVIDRAPVMDTLRWFRDANEVFRKFDVGFAACTYKEMDFGITGEHYKPILQELINIWNR